MISCVIIEDHEPAQRILKKYIADSGKLELIACFSTALEALDFLSEREVDLLFLDIHLPKLSGIDFLSVLPHKPHVILTTAFSEYAVKGYDLDVADYLLKPFSFNRFLQAVLKVEKRLQSPSPINDPAEKIPDSIIVKDGYEYVKIDFDKIFYIRADGDYTHVHCMDKKHFVTYPLRFWLENLPGDQFLQVHRSYLVNVLQIQKVSSNTITINNDNIPVGRVYKKQFRDLYLKSRK